MPTDVRLEESVSSVRTRNLAMAVLFNNVGEVKTLKRSRSRNSNRKYRGMPEWLKGADCKSVGSAYDGSNPSPSTKWVISWRRTTIGSHRGQFGWARPLQVRGKAKRRAHEYNVRGDMVGKMKWQTYLSY